MTNAPSQDAIHRRLRAVMDRPENQSCCDCGDHKPTWASIIVPPASVPPEISAQPMGAFCCFHCSGAHRRLGVHICFVRSVTLDDWKEKEVVAIELGGNKRVNRAFEAKLSSRRAAVEKPNPKSDLEMRDRFVKAKYRDHRYFDPTKYATEKPPTPVKMEPDIDPTLFHGMEAVNLFSPTQISKYVDATATTSHNIPDIHSDEDKINPADEVETTVIRQSSMEKESSGTPAVRLERNEENPSETPNSKDEPKKPVYFLPLKETVTESTEQSVASQGKGPSNHSRARNSRARDDRSLSRSRARRSSRSHDSCDDDSEEKNTGRRSLRRSNSKSPKRSSSQSRRSQLKQSKSKRRLESGQSQEKESSKSSSNQQRSSRGSTEGTETSAPIRRNLSGPSVAKVAMTDSSDSRNGGPTLMRKSSSLLSLSTSNKGSNVDLSGKEHKEMSSLRNATFSAIPSSSSSNRLGKVATTFEQAQRLASEYIMQELAKIQVPSQSNASKQVTMNVGSNDAIKPTNSGRSSLSKSPPRSSVSGRRAKSRNSSSPEMESKREETSNSGRRSTRQADESILADESNKPSSYLSLLNDESGDDYNAAKKRGQEASDEVPREIGGLTTMRVTSKYALAEMEDMQNSFQQDPERPIRRSARRMPTSRNTNRSATQRHQSRSRSRGSTASRSPSRSPSPSDGNRSRLSISRSPSTDIESRNSRSKSPTRQTGDEEEKEEFLAPLVRNPGRKLERAHSHGSSGRRMIRQASSRDVPGEKKTATPLSLQANVNKKSTNPSQGSRPSSRRGMADDTNQSEDVVVDTTTNDIQPQGSIGTSNRAVRANRLRRDPLSSKSDHQARSRGRITSRVDAANQKAAMEQPMMAQPRPARPNRLARTASMSFLDGLDDVIPGPSATQDNPAAATTTTVVAAPGPTRRSDDKNSLSCASSHGNHPRSNRMLDRNGLGSASSHGINPRIVRGKATAAKAAASSGNDRVLQLFAAGPPKDEASTSVNNDDEANDNTSEGAERPTKALSAAALKAMRELKEIIG